MSRPPPSAADLQRSLEAALRFAHAAGAWIVPATAAASAARGDPRAALAGDVSSGALAEARTAGGRDGEQALRAVRDDLGDCRRCRLGQGRNHLVFGVGSPGARVVFVGEGPGEEEDRRGEPFVGRAGKLLDRMLGAIGLDRSRAYIANVVKCRPPGNRTPLPDEAQTCLPFLWGQIDAIGPAAVCALGACAAQNLLGTETPISRLRGRVHRARGIPVVATFHPAYLLRNPAAKRQAWEDLKRLQALAGEGS